MDLSHWNTWHFKNSWHPTPNFNQNFDSKMENFWLDFLHSIPFCKDFPYIPMNVCWTSFFYFFITKLAKYFLMYEELVHCYYNFTLAAHDNNGNFKCSIEKFHELN